MKRFLILLLMLVAPAFAYAESMIWRQGSDFARLLNAPCTNAVVLELIVRYEPQALPEFRAATALVNGQPFEACWHRIAPAGAHIFFDDGDSQEVPLSIFKPETGI